MFAHREDGGPSSWEKTVIGNSLQVRATGLRAAEERSLRDREADEVSQVRVSFPLWHILSKSIWICVHSLLFSECVWPSDCPPDLSPFRDGSKLSFSLS